MSVSRLLLIALLLTCAAWPQEEILQQRDRQVLAASTLRFPEDARYNDVLNRITLRFLPHIREIYGKDPRELKLAVYLSNIGFNAISFHRLVLIDSLLLDGLRRLAQGTVVYGSSVNPYNEELARYLAVLKERRETARVGPGFDPANPYRIPPPAGLTPELEPRAQAVFEEMVAAWLAHEISHALLDHTKEKWEKAIEYTRELESKNVPRESIEGLVKTYVNYEMAKPLELVADRYGAQLAKKAGYTAHGFRRILLFTKRIEEYDENPGLRDHPQAWERWNAVREVFEKVP